MVSHFWVVRVWLGLVELCCVSPGLVVEVCHQQHSSRHSSVLMMVHDRVVTPHLVHLGAALWQQMYDRVKQLVHALSGMRLQDGQMPRALPAAHTPFCPM